VRHLNAVAAHVTGTVQNSHHVTGMLKSSRRIQHLRPNNSYFTAHSLRNHPVHPVYRYRLDVVIHKQKHLAAGRSHGQVVH
jgi:hypothetical protein